MRVLINNVELAAKPKDVAELIKLLSTEQKTKKIPVTEANSSNPEYNAGLADAVKQSQELRQKLAEDPDYNPFPGVVPSKEAAASDALKPNTERTYAADLETGVSDGY